MSRHILAVLIVLSLSISGWSSPADELKEMLARAEALYYEADFAKSIELLLRADELLRQQAGLVQEKTEVKLQLALGYIGLNDRARAKNYLGELYALDSDRRIDPQVFSPKVVQLAEEAKAEQTELRCRSLLDDTQRQLAAGNAAAAVKVIGSNQAKCAGLAPLSPKVAELFYKEGLESYRKALMEDAAQKFRSALRAEPKHELAAQYLELAESKLEVAADKAILSWRKNFGAGEFALAARDYRDVVSRSRSETIEEVRQDYRRTLSALVDSWNKACAGNDGAAMEDIRLRVNTLLPETSFAEDLLAQMSTCTPTGCLQMGTQLALARLRNRVDPKFQPYVLSQLKSASVTVYVKTRIDEKGDVASVEMRGGNPLLYPAVRAAFEQWKFTPAVAGGAARCVDTEIPLVVNFSPN